MSIAKNESWPEANQRYLMARLQTVRAALEQQVASPLLQPEADELIVSESLGEFAASWTNGNVEAAASLCEIAAAALPGTAALDHLCHAFSLSSFERDLLLLCAGPELDGRFSSLCAAAQGDARFNYPTFSLALAALPDAHWNALTPTAPLRSWRLIEVAPGAGTIMQSQLRIDERVLHYLAGVSYLDERLRALVTPFFPRHRLPPSQQLVADRIAEFWEGRNEPGLAPVALLCGPDNAGKRGVAAEVAGRLGLRLHILQMTDVPPAVMEREALIRLWEREAVLLGSALLLEQNEPETSPAVVALLDSLHGLLFVSVPESLRLRDRSAFRVDVPKPDPLEQESLWIEALGQAADGLNGDLGKLVSQFSLGTDEIYAASEQAQEGLTDSDDRTLSASMLWDSCRLLARPRLDDLAQRIVPAAHWNDLVLPDSQLRALREIAAHVRQRAQVYETWGFASKGERGLGISALFAGASGTGKTMAAEVLAGELRLDLYRIDLSQIVSKYIGETEKNLRRVFAAAEEGGAVLLFDEADALFGKRSEVKDSHDRYANIEVSYLLQRMEAYRGLAILTTNLKTSVDPAFLRRLRFVVQFPFPDAHHRAEIWRRVFPAQTPTRGIDVARLARLSIPGGNIRNIALNAAFLAADAADAVTMSHLLRAARVEYAKLEKPLSEAEIGGWA
jgi:hypothetical protein